MKIGKYEVERIKEKDIEYILFKDFNIFCQIHKTHLTGFKEDDIEIISIPNLIALSKYRTKNSIPIYYKSVNRSLTSFTNIYNGIQAYNFKDHCADAITLFDEGVIDFFYYNEYEYSNKNLNSLIEITAGFKCITIDEDYRKFDQGKLMRYQNMVAKWKLNNYIRYYIGFYSVDYLGEKHPYYFYERRKAMSVNSENNMRFFTDNTFFLEYNLKTREQTYLDFSSTILLSKSKNSYFPTFKECINLISEKETSLELFSKIVIPFKNENVGIDFRKISSSEFKDHSTIVNIPII